MGDFFVFFPNWISQFVQFYSYSRSLWNLGTIILYFFLGCFCPDNGQDNNEKIINTVSFDHSNSIFFSFMELVDCRLLDE